MQQLGGLVVRRGGHSSQRVRASERRLRLYACGALCCVQVVVSVDIEQTGTKYDMSRGRRARGDFVA